MKKKGKKKQCICIFCGREFESERRSKKYCCYRCELNREGITQRGKKESDLIKECYVCGGKLQKWRWAYKPPDAFHEECADGLEDIMIGKGGAEAIRMASRKRMRQLSADARKAKESGMDYGQYQAEKYRAEHPWVRPKLKGEK